MSNICLELKLLHHVQTMACSVSWPVNVHSVPKSNTETAGPCGRPKIFFCHLPVFAVDVADDDESPASTVDLTGDGKLGTGLHQLMIWRKSILVPGISHDQHLSARS